MVLPYIVWLVIKWSEAQVLRDFGSKHHLLYISWLVAQIEKVVFFFELAKGAEDQAMNVSMWVTPALGLWRRSELFENQNYENELQFFVADHESERDCPKFELGVNSWVINLFGQQITVGI